MHGLVLAANTEKGNAVGTLYVKTRRATPRGHVARHRVPGRYVGYVTIPGPTCDPWRDTANDSDTDARHILGTL